MEVGCTKKDLNQERHELGIFGVRAQLAPRHLGFFALIFRKSTAADTYRTYSYIKLMLHALKLLTFVCTIFHKSDHFAGKQATKVQKCRFMKSVKKKSW